MREHTHGTASPNASGASGTFPRGARDETAADAASGRRAARPAVAEHLAAELASILARHGLHAALALLNARTRYRFTGLYRVEPPLLRNLDLYDRENPSLGVSGDISMLEDTYCAFAAAMAQPFATPDAAADARLAAHPARATVISYLGVPIFGADGRVRGTLCHFDCRPRLMPEGESELLARVAVLLADDWIGGRIGGAAAPG